jgi:hypothetical protein
LGTGKKGNDKGIGKVMALAGNKLDKGITQEKSRRLVLAEQHTPAAEQTIEVVFDVMSTQVNRAAVQILPASFAGKLPTGSTGIEIGP